MSNTNNKLLSITGMMFASLSSRVFSAAFAALALLLGTQTVFAFPTGGGGCFFCSPYNLGGSTITFDLTSSDANGLAPITFNFLPDPIQDPLNPPNVKNGRLCLSGKIHATIASDDGTGEAVYDLLGSDDSNSNRGVCYKNVTQTCDEYPDFAAQNSNSCTQDNCTYTVPALEDVTDVSSLLDGRFKVDPSLTDAETGGPYNACTASSSTGTICNFEVGFNFNNGIPPNLFPAIYTLENELVDANVVLNATEVCIECPPQAVNLKPGTAALKSKSDTIRACEAIALKTDWCNDLQTVGVDCIGDGDPGNPPIGGMNTAMGDFQILETTGEICVSDLDDLKTLPSCETAVAIAACGDGPGFITYPESFQETTCNSSGAEIYSFSPAEGGGTAVVNLAAIGATPDAPGYAGDNTIPPILPGWAAIISTPDNQVNIWDFSGADMFRIAFIHSRNSNDIITGSLGRDVILGGSGADTVNGNDGNDVLQGGDNTDMLNGDEGDDLLLGYECNGPNAACSSFLNNGSDDDDLNGGPGNDCLDGGRGNDSTTGDAGSDAFVLFGDTDSDTFNDFMTGEYDPEEPGEVDVVVDLTGNAVVTWVPRKRSVPGKCTINTGGNNAITLLGIEEDDCYENDASANAGISVLGGNDLPEQCAEHPYTFQ